MTALPGDDPRQQPEQRAGVRAVDRRIRRAQAPQPDAVHAQLLVAELLDLDAERAHRVDGRHRVGGAPESLHVRLPLAEPAEQDGAVRDRLVPGHGNVPDDRDSRFDLHSIALSRSCVP